jgi:hypothetical protein
VAIYPNGVEIGGRVIIGPREKAELHAHFLINKWLETHPTQNALKSQINDNQHT